MYPFVRLAKEIVLYRNAPALPVLGAHVSQHICWPWDLDMFAELNNGRTLTLYDLGRIAAGHRMGLSKALAAEGWGLAVAGVSVRYRRRIRAFERMEMRTRCIGWDARFIYLEQALWKGAECANHMLLRSAVTSAAGIVAPVRLLQAMGQEQDSPELPGWVQDWVQAEAGRPWPPER